MSWVFLMFRLWWIADTGDEYPYIYITHVIYASWLSQARLWILSRQTCWAGRWLLTVVLHQSVTDSNITITCFTSAQVCFSWCWWTWPCTFQTEYRIFPSNSVFSAASTQQIHLGPDHRQHQREGLTNLRTFGSNWYLTKPFSFS